MADLRDRHSDHDPLLIASLLDRDLDDGEREVAGSRIAACGACAALYADLVALSDATATLPTPPRPRAFTLTAADAARLWGPIAGEPSASTPRLAGVTTDPGTSAAHAAHDTMLVASLADDSLASPERDAAQALVAGCSLCAALHVDLVALRSATQAMPTPARPRDYTLTPDDAARHRRAGWRRFVAAFGSSRDVFSRPLAVGLTTLGLAGLLVATLPSIMSGGAASTGTTVTESAGAPITAADQAVPTDESGQGAAPVAPVAAASADRLSVAAAAGSAQPVAGGTDRFGTILTDRPSPTPGVAADGGGSAKGIGGAPGRSKELTGSTNLNVGHDTSGLSLLAVLSGVFLIVGLGLFAIRWTAGRFGD